MYDIDEQIKITENNYNNAKNTRKNCEEAERTEFKAWMQLRVDKAKQNPPVLASKKVIRTTNRYPVYNVWQRKSEPKLIKQRGIVKLNQDINIAYHLRGYQPASGEWYVESESGHTAYRLTDDWTEDI